MGSPLSRVICLPGFGDVSRYWSGLCGEWLGSVPVGIEWAGLWGGKTPKDPVEEFVGRALDETKSSDVVVGHSMGGRVAVEVANQVSPRGVILLAPAVGRVPGFLAPEFVKLWIRNGVRPTRRPDPETGEMVTLEVSSDYATGWLRRPHPDVEGLRGLKVLTVLMDEDYDLDEEAAALLSDVSHVEVVEGPHRWWESDVACHEIGRLVRAWGRGL